MKQAALIPFVCGAGAQKIECVQGAVDLKKRGLNTTLAKAGIDAGWFEDPELIYNSDDGRAAHDNLTPLGSPRRRDLVLRHCRHLCDSVANAIGQGRPILTLGGDHTMAAASVAGLAKAEKSHGRTGLLWVDAHPDLNTWETTVSKALHGMPVAALLGWGDKDLCTLGGPQPVLKPENLFYVGIHDIEPPEQEALDRFNIPYMTAENVRKIGVAAALDKAAQTLAKNTDCMALSLDLDSMDPQDAPAVGSPVEGGLRSKDLLPALEETVRNHHFDLFEIAEYNPAVNGADQTYDLIVDIARIFLNGK